MNKFKRVSKNEIRISTNDYSVLYTGYHVGELPKSFAFIYDENEEKEGHSAWFNLGGLTYINIK